MWAYKYLTDRTHEGKAFRVLTIVDEIIRECVAIKVTRKLTAGDVLAHLTELLVTRNSPGHPHFGIGPEFCAKIVREWLT